ncbi:MAG: SAM-dependent methyltransferase [Eubacterium sp.]|nr:SAM-dependent methyltransferase [Eubacterium sp.]
MSDEDDEKGTYYTPLHLVNLIMDETYPWEGEYKDTTFFDPSCGSGIFLVEAYRRHVCRWMSQNDVHTIDCDQLNLLLKKSIFGVDINEEAIRVASFSLSLAMCDFLDPRSIWDKLSFPRLLDNNLISSDFFNEEKSFNNRRYDVIIGNPPWQSNITGKTKAYLKKVNRIISDKQIAQAFSIKCSELCKQNGIICLLMPSKGLLFNRSGNGKAYRANLFADNNVLAIINLSVYRKFLFDHASGPATAIIYTPKKEEINQLIVYCTPKPNYTIEDTRKFSIDPTDICRIPYDIINDDRIWKIAMWGGPRDLELIGKMQNTFAPMTSFIEENRMITAEGFKRGNRKNKCYDFKGLPLVEVKTFKPYYVSSDELPTVDFDDFECIVKNARKIFAAPHLIIKQSHKNGAILSEVLDYDAVFNHSILGVHGDINKLKYLSVIIGSKVFSYYHILTNRKWLVERDELEAGDIWQTPIPSPSDAEIEEACEIFDELVISPTKKEKAEQFVRHMYRLKEYEGYQIDDVIDYVYDYFKNKQRSVSFKSPSADTYKLYYNSIAEILTNTFGTGTNLSGNLYFGDAPLTVLVLNVAQQTAKEFNIITNNDRLNEILLSLDNSLVDNQKMVFVRRNLRIYQQDKIYIVKPAQCKYWTYSAACRDADEIFEDVSKTWR